MTKDYITYRTENLNILGHNELADDERNKS